MANPQKKYDPLTTVIQVKPDPRQFIVEEIPAMTIITLALFALCLTSGIISTLLLIPILFFIVYLIYRYIGMRKRIFTITEEVLIFQRGVFSQKSDFTELYRIVDYQEQCTFIQQMLGLKTISVFSGERIEGRINITGVKAKVKLVELIRLRVENNKQKKKIHEITNR